MTTTDNALLAARSAQLYYTYARAVDEGDLDTLRAIATDDIKTSRGTNPTVDGVEAFLDVYRAHNDLHIPVCKHVVTNIMARRVGADIVTHAYFQATFLEAGKTRIIIGRYDDVHRGASGVAVQPAVLPGQGSSDRVHARAGAGRCARWGARERHLPGTGRHAHAAGLLRA